MAREIPEVVRAAAGLAATVLDEARKLPSTLPGIPVRLIGLAMQQAMKVQQHYAGLVARGDELFTGLRGQNEPGLATFDDDEPAPLSSNGFRDSPFDRAGGTATADDTLSDAEVESLPSDPAADAVTSVVDTLAEQVETGEQSIEELVNEAPAIEEILDEIAIDELVDQAPTLEETAPGASVDDAPVTEDADALESALLESDASPAGGDSSADADADADVTVDVATSVDVLTPDGDVATVAAAVTDEGVAAPEAPTDETPSDETPSDETPSDETTDAGTGADTVATDESGSDVASATGARTDVAGSDTSEEDTAIADGATADQVGETSATPTDDAGRGNGRSGSQAVGAAPVDGYDSFSIAQLRGRLRGYALSSVQDLLAYEEATRAREPYLRMLRNRLEKLEQQAIESSPLAPRGA